MGFTPAPVCDEAIDRLCELDIDRIHYMDAAHWTQAVVGEALTPTRRILGRFVASERRCVIAATLGCLAFFSVIIAAAAHLHSRNDRLSNVHLSPVVRAIPPVEVLVSVRSTGYKNVYCTQLPPPADRGAAPRPTNFFGVADLKLLFALIPAMLFMFFGLAIVVDDFLVPSLEALCEQLHLLEDVAGATLMAAGSSAPELCMGLLAVFWTKDDIGIGTIMGSAIFNILVIIGLSAVLAHDVLDLDFRPLVSDSIVYFSAIVLVLFSVAFFTPGKALWWMGLLLVLGYVDYIVFMKWNDKPYFGHRANRHVRGEEVSWESGTNYGKLNPRSQWHTCLSSAQTTNHVVNSSRSEDEEAIPNRRPLGAPDDNESPV